MKNNRLRWAVPAATVVAVGAAFVIPTLASASAEELPATTPAELLVALAEAEPTAMSGTAVYTARLGLPEMPAEMTGGADPLNLLSGSSTIRMWTDGAERSRVIDGMQAWTYSSAKNEVVHVTLDQAAQDAIAEHKTTAEDAAGAAETPEIPTPEALADQVLALAGISSDVALAENVVVAGRDAYQLVVTPLTDETLVDRIVIAIDGDTLVPLSFQAWSTQDEAAPALELAFTDVTMAAPSDAALAFSTPAGAPVQEKVIGAAELAAAEEAKATEGAQEFDPSAMTPGFGALPEGVAITGQGWATVVERSGIDVAGLIAGDPAAVADETADSPWAGRPAEALAEEFKGDGTGFGIDGTALYDQLTTRVDGGRILSSALLSVLVTDDGRVFVGAVPTQTLLATAGLA